MDNTDTRAVLSDKLDDLTLELMLHDVGKLPAAWRLPGLYEMSVEDFTLQCVAAYDHFVVAIEGHMSVMKDSSRVHRVCIITVDSVEGAPLTKIEKHRAFH